MNTENMTPQEFWATLSEPEKVETIKSLLDETRYPLSQYLERTFNDSLANGHVFGGEDIFILLLGAKGLTEKTITTEKLAGEIAESETNAIVKKPFGDKRQCKNYADNCEFWNEHDYASFRAINWDSGQALEANWCMPEEKYEVIIHDLEVSMTYCQLVGVGDMCYLLAQRGWNLANANIRFKSNILFIDNNMQFIHTTDRALLALTEPSDIEDDEAASEEIN
jgi:hypothetical protein